MRVRGEVLSEAATILVLAAAGGFALTLVVLALRTRARMVAAHGAGVILGALAGVVLYAIGFVASTAAVEPEGLHRLVLQALTTPTLVGAFVVLLGAALGFLTARYTWRFEGLVAYAALASVVAGYMIYALTVTLPRVPKEQLPLSVLLFVAETASLSMVVVYAFYGFDIYMKRRWRRSADKVPFSRRYAPKVAFHVTIFNEPTAMVLETLHALRRLDYPRDRIQIMVLDDSTNERLRAPLEAYCREHGLDYLHRLDRRGFKAGALNAALKRTDPDVELVAVIDADYQVEPEYLRETVGYFINPRVAFVQTPQDYRNTHQSFLSRQYYYADGYFYRAVLPSRNEENTIIFCGTMGLMRRRVLEAAGGWGEDFITEDAELSVRVVERGFDSLYLNKTYGRGLAPATYDAYRKQHYRWSFGSIKILKAHFRKFWLSPMTLRQKLDFLVGNLHWFDGAYVVVIAGILAILALADFLGFPLVTYHQREIWLAGLVPLFLLLDGYVRLHVALRRSMNVSLKGTLAVMGMWFAIKFNNMRAAIKSLVGFRLAFVRTPKAPEGRPTRRQSLLLAIRLARFESLMLLALSLIASLAAIKGGALLLDGAGLREVGARLILALWLYYYAAIFLCAPLYAYLSYATFVPDAELYPSRGPRRVETFATR